MWQPYTPADTSSFTAYNSQSGLTAYTSHSTYPLSPYSSISSPPSLSPLTLSYTPHMIKDILRGTPGFPEEETEEEERHQAEEDDCPIWPAHPLLQGPPPGSPGAPGQQHQVQGADQSAHHLVHLLNPLSLLLPNTCFSSSTGLPPRYENIKSILLFPLNHIGPPVQIKIQLCSSPQLHQLVHHQHHHWVDRRSHKKLRTTFSGSQVAQVGFFKSCSTTFASAQIIVCTTLVDLY